MRIRFVLVLVLVVMLGGMSPLKAHDTVDLLVREIRIVESQDGGTQLLLRSPLTLAYASELAARETTGVLEAPFLITEWVDGTPFYRVDSSAVREDRQAFGEFLLRDYRFSSFGRPVLPQQIEFCVIDTHAPGKLSTGLDGTLSLLEHCSELTESPYVIDALVVASVYLPWVRQTDSLQITIQSAKFLLPQGMHFRTKIVDHRTSGTPQLRLFDRLWPPPVTFSGGGPEECHPLMVPGTRTGFCVM